MGSGSENVGPGGGVVVGIPVEPRSRGGNDKEIAGSGSEMETRVPVGLGSRGGNDSVIEGSGSRMAGCGVTVGSEIAGGVPESYPSSPENQIITSVLRGSRYSRDGSLTLNSQTIGESSQKEGRNDNLGNHDFEENS